MGMASVKRITEKLNSQLAEAKRVKNKADVRIKSEAKNSKSVTKENEKLAIQDAANEEQRAKKKAANQRADAIDGSGPKAKVEEKADREAKKEEKAEAREEKKA